MECKELSKQLSAYMDEALDETTASEFAAHIGTCADCANAHEQMLDLRLALKKHGMRYKAPSSLPHRIRHALSKQRPLRRRVMQFPWAWINLGLFSASSAAFAFTLVLYMAAPTETERLDQEIVASHFRSLLPDHLADVASSDQHTVKPWFSGKLDFSPPVHDLVKEGFPLIGGRLDYIDARPVAALAYRHNRHVLNLYVWPNKVKSNVPAQVTSKQGFQLIGWTQSGMTYKVISDINAQDLMGFKHQLASQIDKDQ